MIATNALSALLLLLAPPTTAPSPAVVAQDQSIPTDGSRVVFIGDSITQAGHFVIDVEAYLLTRFPDRTITIINHGLSSETAAGTSEPDHPNRRPWIHDRFDRDVTAWEPDVVVACYGMNDGIYHPFSPDRFAKYQEGMRRLIARARDDAGARIDLMTPPPYDPYRRRVGDPDAEHWGYRYPAVDYDDVLARYGDWIGSLRSDDLLVIDVHAEVADHVARRREDRVSYSLAPDGVHPDATGHWLIAQALLRAWGAPAGVAEARVDATRAEGVSGEVRDVSTRDGVVAFVWRTPLPMPIDPAWDAESIRLEDVAGRLNRYRLTISGLEESRYRLLAAGEEDGEPVEVGRFTAEELAEGIDLTALPEFPTVAASLEVLRRLTELRSAQAQAWRASIRGESPADAPPPPGEDEAAMGPIRDLCKPRDLFIRIEPVAGRAP